MVSRIRGLAPVGLVALLGLAVLHGCRPAVSPVSGLPLLHEGETHERLDDQLASGYWADYPSGRDLLCANGTRVPFDWRTPVILFAGPRPALAHFNLPPDRYPLVGVLDGTTGAVIELYAVRDGTLIRPR
jgi:hypothetical protein